MRFQPAHLQMRTRGVEGGGRRGGRFHGASSSSGPGICHRFAGTWKTPRRKKACVLGVCGAVELQLPPPRVVDRVPLAGLAAPWKKDARIGSLDGNLEGWLDGWMLMPVERLSWAANAEHALKPAAGQGPPAVAQWFQRIAVQSGPCSLWAFNPPTDRAACLMQRIRRRRRRWAGHPPHAPRSVGRSVVSRKVDRLTAAFTSTHQGYRDMHHVVVAAISPVAPPPRPAPSKRQRAGGPQKANRRRPGASTAL